MVLNFLDQAENEAFDRLRGYTEDIAVLKPHRQQGLAKALITKSMHMFKRMGIKEVALSVDSENESGALRLYQNLGYKTKLKRTVYRKPIH
jgi:ribosomal protein S18 acetylase RimI-like enzyme